MAHFAPPPDGILGEYDVDSKLAVGSIWRMQVGVGGLGADVALWGGDGLVVRSNNPGVIANPLEERSSGPLRIFRLKGLTLGTTMLEAGRGAGTPWISLQVQVISMAERKTNGDGYVTLTRPHMALNAASSPVTYTMTYTRRVPHNVSADEILAMAMSAGSLKHLVFSAHGYIAYGDSGIADSIIEIGKGLNKSNIGVFDELKRLMGGGVIWFGACGIGNDQAQNQERARRSGCYVVAPVMYMTPKPGQPRRIPQGMVDMYDRFTPKVFTPSGGLMPWSSFLRLGNHLGFRF